MQKLIAALGSINSCYYFRNIKRLIAHHFFIMLCVILGDKGAGFSTIFALCSEKGFKLEESKFLFQPLMCYVDRFGMYSQFVHMNEFHPLLTYCIWITWVVWSPVLDNAWVSLLPVRRGTNNKKEKRWSLPGELQILGEALFLQGSLWAEPSSHVFLQLLCILRNQLSNPVPFLIWWYLGLAGI